MRSRASGAACLDACDFELTSFERATPDRAGARPYRPAVQQ